MAHLQKAGNLSAWQGKTSEDRSRPNKPRQTRHEHLFSHPCRHVHMASLACPATGLWDGSPDQHHRGDVDDRPGQRHLRLFEEALEPPEQRVQGFPGDGLYQDLLAAGPVQLLQRGRRRTQDSNRPRTFGFQEIADPPGRPDRPDPDLNADVDPGKWDRSVEESRIEEGARRKPCKTAACFISGRASWRCRRRSFACGRRGAAAPRCWRR